MLFKQRNDDFGKDDPISHCLPLGTPRRDADALPFKIVQTRGLMILLQEGDASFRQVFLDGRPLPEDPQPSWMGYSVGKWDRDALVVETIGLRDQGWLDGLGHPHSDALPSRQVSFYLLIPASTKRAISGPASGRPSRNAFLRIA
jgi:hypothetical protein